MCQHTTWYNVQGNQQNEGGKLATNKRRGIFPVSYSRKNFLRAQSNRFLLQCLPQTTLRVHQALLPGRMHTYIFRKR